LIPAPLATVPASRASRPSAPPASVLAQRPGTSRARHVGGIKRFAVESLAGLAGIAKLPALLRDSERFAAPPA
jgi:hypothetical protein